MIYNVIERKKSTPASDIAIGDSLYCTVDGVRTELVVVQQGNPDASIYDSSCDGTWLMMKYCREGTWATSSANKYENSTVDSYLNGVFASKLNINKIIKYVKIPYRQGGGQGAIQKGSNGLDVKLFLLSAIETGINDSYAGNDGSKLDYFISGNDIDARAKRIAVMQDGTATHWWTRTPVLGTTQYAVLISGEGSYFTGGSTSVSRTDYGVRPCFIIPSDTKIDASGNILI